jgi:hypothetical protein
LIGVFPLFRGGQRRITLDDGSRRGSFPAVAFAPDGPMVVVYQGTSAPALFYTTGTIVGDGSYNATEFALTKGDARRGFTPSLAFDSAGHVIAVYRGTDNLRLFYVSGRLDSQGRDRRQRAPSDHTGRGTAWLHAVGHSQRRRAMVDRLRGNG